jgi:predicted nucleotidyltransferase
MTADEVLAKIEAHKTELLHLGVRRLGLFGSAVRNELTASSDLDFVGEWSQFTYDNFLGTKLLLEQLFQRPVELGTLRSLRPSVTAAITAELRYTCRLR